MQRSGPKAGGVVRQCRAVFAIFDQHIGFEIQVAPRAEMIEVDIAGYEPDGSLLVDRAADRHRHDVVSVGGEGAPGAGEGPLGPEVAEARRDVVRIVVADFVVPKQPQPFGGPREDSDGAAHGTVAEDAGRRAAKDLDARDLIGRELRPIYPTAKGVVGGNAIP